MAYQKIIVLDTSPIPISHADSGRFNIRLLFIFRLNNPVVIGGQQIVPRNTLANLLEQEPHLTDLLNEDTSNGILDGSLTFEIYPAVQKKAESYMQFLQRMIQVYVEQRVEINRTVRKAWRFYGWSVNPANGVIKDSNGNVVE